MIRNNNKSPRQNVRTLAIIFFVTSLVAFAVGFFMDKTYRDKKTRCTARTTGELINIESKLSSGRVSHMEYSGVYVYSLDGNGIHRVNGGWSRSKDKKQSVTVMYDPNDPGFSYVRGELERRYTPYLFSAIAFIFGIIIIVVLKTSKAPILAKDYDGNIFDEQKGPFYD